MGTQRFYTGETPPPNVPAETQSIRPVPDTRTSDGYKDYGVDNSYTYDPGVLFLPVASLEPKYAVVRVHGGVSFRHVRAEGHKKDTPPILPLAADVRNVAGVVVDKLLASSVFIAAPTPNPSGVGYDWSVRAEYTYATTIPAASGGPRIPGRSVLYAGRLPYPVTPQDAVAEQIVPSSSGTDTDSLFPAPTVDDVTNGRVVWPFTVLSPGFFDPTQVVG